jgi:hypothetical protein
MKKLSGHLVKLNTALFIIYTVILVGGALRFYSVWLGPGGDFFAGLMLWSFYVSLPQGDVDFATRFIGVPAIQYLLPIALSIAGIFLNRTRYLAIHLGLILVVVVSVAMVFSFDLDIVGV